MLTAYSFSQSAGAAATLARARAAGIGGQGGRSIFLFGGVKKLADKMYMAFYQVCDSPEGGEDKNPQIGLPQDKLLGHLLAHPEDIQFYPWVLERFPEMFSRTRLSLNNGYTVH